MTVTPAPSNAAWAPPVLGDDPTEWVRTDAFSGPWWTADASGSVDVIGETVMVGSGSTWSASGLARNGAPGSVQGIVVSAELRDAAGVSLGVVTAPVAVAPVRPGEPAPFSVTSAVPVASVATVDWSATSTPSTAVRPAVEIEESWRHPRDLPTELAGSVIASAPAGAMSIVVAWLDVDLRVISVSQVPVVSLGTTTPTAGLAATELGDFTTPGPVVPVADAQPMFWAVAS